MPPTQARPRLRKPLTQDPIYRQGLGFHTDLEVQDPDSMRVDAQLQEDGDRRVGVGCNRWRVRQKAPVWCVTVPPHAQVVDGGLDPALWRPMV